MKSSTSLHRKRQPFLIIAGVAATLIFTIPTYLAFSAGPSDPQKPVGYVFITLYGAFLGIVAGFTLYGYLRAAAATTRFSMFALWILIALLSTAIFIFLFMSKFRAA